MTTINKRFDSDNTLSGVIRQQSSRLEVDPETFVSNLFEAGLLQWHSNPQAQALLNEIPDEKSPTKNP